MIDWITIKYDIGDFEAWKQSINIPFVANVDIDNAEIKTKKRNEKIITTYRANWETYRLIVREVLNTNTRKTLFYLTIKGSVHKNHYTGKNYEPFTWQQLQLQVNHICNTLSINATSAQISNIEVGVNVSPLFKVLPFLMQNIISYKGIPFNRYEPDKKGRCLGIYCNLTKYQVKIYDKGLQNDLPQNLMRFELRFLCMEKLKIHKIKFLSDLQQRPKIEGLLPMLLEAWENVLIFDIDPDKFPMWQTTIAGQNAKYWEGLKEKKGSSSYYETLARFKKLVIENGNGWQQQVKKLIQNEWEGLFKNRTIFTSGKQTNKKVKPDKFHIKIKGKLVRFCRSCGKDITHQKRGSVFCSPKYVGEAAAHQCRNQNSNPRNNFKNKIKKIKGRGVLLDILPFIEKNKKGFYSITQGGGLIKEQGKKRKTLKF